MDQSTITLWLAIIALVTSVFLAALRTFEFFCDRKLGLSLTTSLISDPDMGNTITLLNASSRPINIYFFELVWVKRNRIGRWLKSIRTIVSRDSPYEHEGCDFTIPAHSQFSLPFRHGDHFQWGERLNEDIYLKLWLVGRKKPLWLFVTGYRV